MLQPLSKSSLTGNRPRPIDRMHKRVDRVLRVRRNIPVAGGLVLRLEDGIWSGEFPAEVTEAVRKAQFAARLSGK